MKYLIIILFYFFMVTVAFTNYRKPSGINYSCNVKCWADGPGKASCLIIQNADHSYFYFSSEPKLIVDGIHYPNKIAKIKRSNFNAKDIPVEVSEGAELLIWCHTNEKT